MKPLPLEFDGRGDQGKISDLTAYRFKTIERSDMTCLMEKSRGGQGRKSYEVVILRGVPEKTFPDGSVCLAHESMPSPEMWGTSGWTYTTLEEAQKKFVDVLMR